VSEYLDLHVIPRPEDSRSCERMADLLSTAHYATIGLTIATGLLNERVRSMRRIFEEHGVNTVLRADFKPDSRTELLRLLRRFRNLYDVVAVRCVNQQVATVSCRDRRVDIVFFDVANRNLSFSHTFARLLRGAVEFNLVSDLLDQTDWWAFSKVHKAILVAREHHVKIILSSGARNYEMVRSPFQVSALAMTLGLTQEESIRGVSSTPLSIVRENRMKRAPEYVEQGVKIIIPSGQ
jgi:RNase P/RNase MRP subunit p30